MTYVLDLFAGPGGVSQAAADLGLRVRGLERDTDACDTARAAGHYRHQCDVSGPGYPSSIPGVWGRPDGIWGSPPCPGFSRAGLERGRGDLPLLLDALENVASGLWGITRAIETVRELQADHRSALVLEPLRYALELQPGWLALEQVPAVLPVWEGVADVLRAHGWTAAAGQLSAEQFGLPQVRRRAILVARGPAESLIYGRAMLPSPTHSRYHGSNPQRLDHGLPRWRSMRDALGWGMSDRPYPSLAPGVEGARSGQDPMMVGGSGARRMLQREVEARRYTARDGALLSGWDLETRRAMRLTVQDAALLQGFPADYPWRGNRTQQFRQVGDAVPPPLARHIIQAAATSWPTQTQEDAAA